MSPISNYLVLLLLRSLQRINTGEELIFLVFGHGFSKSFLLFPVITPSVTKTPQAKTTLQDRTLKHCIEIKHIASTNKSNTNYSDP